MRFDESSTFKKVEGAREKKKAGREKSGRRTYLFRNIIFKL